jgi:ubiquinol-cytochrome c reductase iron-sulfur subunit
MAFVARNSPALLRGLAGRALFAGRTIATTATQRQEQNSSTFNSPFGRTGSRVPDFSKYRSKAGSGSGLVFQYFMVGTMGALAAMGAKATVQGEWCGRWAQR